ncbi:hypothetical protein O9G_005454 [Rozella allomycis CSF55]|uniref:Transcription regulator Rua1 C-terminal domain-containing protein n=1 Tax=Rozella allomycis (strain CSF55) TaxID=988480 RepID=A0A075AN48_ROZAC|nr:hypothetical protein O9G_005454 [Rozella allomycis CSF55]|eukprot:EPZ31220.1 hypothetical protein O9G_005454 [Rozella allomycis CSF55]
MNITDQGETFRGVCENAELKGMKGGVGRCNLPCIKEILSEYVSVKATSIDEDDRLEKFVGLQRDVCEDRERDIESDERRKQPVRFEGDLYSPRWVRNRASKKEGLCRFCRKETWLCLKDSAYW